MRNFITLLLAALVVIGLPYLIDKFFNLYVR